MQLTEYSLNCRRTLPTLATDMYYLTGVPNHNEDCLAMPMKILDRVHMILGMLSELHELDAAMQKGDKVGIGEELTDIMWYCMNYAYIIGASIEEIDMQNPVDKLGSDFYDLASAISQLSDANKKYLAYKRPIDPINDVKYLMIVINITLNIYKSEDIDPSINLQNNIDKLRVRFPHKFDIVLAQEENRNLINERKELEK